MHTLSDLEVKHADSNENMVMKRPNTKSHKRFNAMNSMKNNFQSFDYTNTVTSPPNYELSLKEPDTPSIFDNSRGGLGTEASGAKHSSRLVSGSHLSSTL